MFDDQFNNSPLGKPQNPFQPVKPIDQPSNIEDKKSVEDIFIESESEKNNLPQNQPTKGIDIREQIIKNNFPVTENNYEQDVFGGKSFPWSKFLSIFLMVLAGVAVLIVIIFAVNFLLKGNQKKELLINQNFNNIGNQEVNETLIESEENVEQVNDSDNNQDTQDDQAPIIDDRNRDSDGDGLTDWEEINIYKTDPFNPDTDGDGLTDWAEVMIYKTDPLNPDTDGDGYTDGYEVINNYDPLDPTPGARLYNVPGLE